jgi:hypothetical protein
MPPRAARPAMSPDPDGGFDAGALFQVMLDGMSALESAIENQTSMLRSQLDAQLRYSMGAGRQGGADHAAGMMSQYQPRMREGVLRNVMSSGGVPHDATAGMTKASGIGALTSLQNLRAYGAQQLGEMIAGTPLYESQPGHGTTAPGSRGGMTSGGTVPGGGAPMPPTPAGSGGPGASAPLPLPAGSYGGGGGGGGSGGSGGSGSGTGGSGGGAGGATPFGGFWQAQGRHAAGPSQTTLNMAQNIGARVAMSGGTPSGIMGMLKKVPGLGLAVDAATGIAGAYTNQREAGRVYQEVEGGSNLSAQNERVHSLIYQASMFGLMPEGAAAQAFGDVTALGYNRAATNQANQGQNRQSALNFIYHQYNSTGTDVDQSVEILQTASQNATVSLKSVSDAMDALSDTAGKAGTNAENARNNFNSLLNTAIQSGAANGSAQLAGGISTMQSSYGNAFSNTSFSGQMSSGMQYMLSGQYGITPSATQYLMRTNPQQYQNMLSGSALQFIQQLPGMSSQMMSALQQMIQQGGGANAIKQQPDLAQQIGSQFLNQFQMSANIDLNVWASFLSQVSGVSLTPGNVMQWVIEQVAGNSNASYGGVGGSGSGSSVSAGSTGSAPTGQYGLAQGTAAQGSGRALGLNGPTSPAQSWQQVLQNGNNPGAANAYLGQEQSSGQRNPVLEALLQNVQSGAQVAVKTSSGTRVMSFTDAMKYYPNEMQAGDVQFYSSSGAALGGTSAITQGLVNSGANVGPEEKSKGAGAKSGVSWSQWSKQHPGQTGGGVTVNLSTEAKQLLKLLPSNADNAAASATVPTPPYVASASR